MNMTDMLLQMTLQAAWQVPDVAQSTGSSQSSANSQGTSFQELLDQRRDQLTQQSGDKTTGTQQPEDNTATQEPVDPTQPQPEEQPETMELQAAVFAPYLLNNNVTPVVQQGEVEPQAVVTAPVQTLTTAVETPVEENTVQLPQQVQTDSGLTQQVEPQQVQVLSQAQEPQQTQQTSQPADTLNEQTVPTQQPQETVVTTEQTAQQPQQEQSQDLTQSAPQDGSKDQKLDNTAVSSWQTPLFRNVETTPVRVGDAEVDMTASTQEVDNKLGDMLKTALQQGEQRLEITLTPSNLGTVVAEFTRSPEGILHVVLHAESEQTAKLLSDHASSLGLLLQDSTNSQVRVEVPQPQQSQSMWQQPDQEQGQQQQQQQQQQQHTPRQETESFLHQLRLGLVQNQTEAV